MNVHGRFPCTPSFVALVQFSGQRVSRKHHRDGPRHCPNSRTDERTSAKKIDQPERIVTVVYFFSDTGNYSARARVDIEEELLGGREGPRYSGALYIRADLSWSIQFSWQLTPRLGTEEFTADTGAHICTGCCRCIAALAAHAGVRMNFDKTARISTEDRTAARRRASGEDSLTRFSPDFVYTPDMCGKRFFFTHVVSPRSSASEIDTFHEPVIDCWLYTWECAG